MGILSLLNKVSVQTEVKPIDSNNSTVDYIVRLEEETTEDVVIKLQDKNSTNTNYTLRAHPTSA